MPTKGMSISFTLLIGGGPFQILVVVAIRKVKELGILDGGRILVENDKLDWVMSLQIQHASNSIFLDEVANVILCNEENEQ